MSTDFLLFVLAAIFAGARALQGVLGINTKLDLGWVAITLLILTQVL